MSYEDLAPVNASLNAAATVALLLGFFFIKTGRVKAHIITMITALVISAVFLTCYLVYHYHVGSVKFAGQGIVRPVYFTLLISHIILAVVNLPLIIMTVVPALRQRFDKHRRWAKITYPSWLYVSISGVIVYMMCYQWYGPPIK